MYTHDHILRVLIAKSCCAQRCLEMVLPTSTWYRIDPNSKKVWSTGIGLSALQQHNWISVSRAHIEVQGFQDFARHIQILQCQFLLHHLSEYRVQNHHAQSSEKSTLFTIAHTNYRLHVFTAKLQKSNNLKLTSASSSGFPPEHGIHCWRTPWRWHSSAPRSRTRIGSLKGSNKRGKKRRGEVQVLLWYQDHGLVEEKTNSRDTRERRGRRWLPAAWLVTGETEGDLSWLLLVNYFWSNLLSSAIPFALFPMHSTIISGLFRITPQANN
jgi:hypothetical protein